MAQVVEYLLKQYKAFCSNLPPSCLYQWRVTDPPPAPVLGFEFSISSLLQIYFFKGLDSRLKVCGLYCVCHSSVP
jgi:hypothetical protein